MAQKEYVSPSVEVCALFTEDVITASGQFVETDTKGNNEYYTVGGFQSGWLG